DLGLAGGHRRHRAVPRSGTAALGTGDDGGHTDEVGHDVIRMGGGQGGGGAVAARVGDGHDTGGPGTVDILLAVTDVDDGPLRTVSGEPAKSGGFVVDASDHDGEIPTDARPIKVGQERGLPGGADDTGGGSL